MNAKEQASAAKKFVKKWLDIEKEYGKIGEKQNDQTFWNNLLFDVLGVSDKSCIEYQKKVVVDGQDKFIDGYIKDTLVLIEHKSSDISLDKPELQSGGAMLTPYEQADRYAKELDQNEVPKWIVVSNFKEIRIYDRNKKNTKNITYDTVKLEDLPEQYHRLKFLVDTNDKNTAEQETVSLKAGDLVGVLYNALKEKYENPEDAETQKSLNKLCVRLVFCLYAEDAELFPSKTSFHEYLATFNPVNVGFALQQLFKVLDTKKEERRTLPSPLLKDFPYVNGGLFADDDIEIPPFDEQTVKILLEDCSAHFDWAKINPTIFGAIFESTLNNETRRSGGMHYTSIENIHKVIDPLFLDDLTAELEEIRQIESGKIRYRKLNEYQKKLAGLKFLDPACGSGNFLTETYMSLRRLENKALAYKDSADKEATQSRLLTDDIVQVNISQFYGIEINDFAVSVAKTALWIAEAQMLEETIQISPDYKPKFFPLKTFDNIKEDNALRIDWNEVVPKEELNYIMGNPPFVGARMKNAEQAADIENIFGKKWKGANNLDYVACWYKKSADLMTNNKNIRAALVSTNSITQGEQTAVLWENLFNDGVHIDFAHRTFIWNNEATDKAHVHCVIVGFSKSNNIKKILFDCEQKQNPANINAYLFDAPNVFIHSRSKPISDVPEMVFGSMPNDGGYLSNYTTEDMQKIVKQYPATETVFRQIYGAEEFINNKKRYCLWLKDVSPQIIRNTKPIADAVNAVNEMRLQSNRDATKRLADTPALFGEIRQPETDYLLVPRVSSENRRYIPIGFMSANVIASDAVQIIPNATIYHFGILTSSVHNAWMRAVCGRLEMRYRYSAKIVYNNFPWCDVTDAQRAEIEKTAQGILDARAKYPDSSLADLYDELTMPPELRKAHKENDKAVLKAYGLKADTTEEEIVAFLMKRYQELVKKL